MYERSPLKGTVTSERSPSSSEREDEECKLGIEDNELGAEMDGRMGESRDDEGVAAQMLREDRITVQWDAVNRCRKG